MWASPYIADGKVYICDANGTSGATGPSGTGSNIADGSTQWDYVSEADELIDGAVTWRYVASNTAPSLVLAFGITSGEAGYGACHQMTTAAGHFLLYTDEVNGYHVYSETAGTWAAVTLGGGGSQVSVADPATFVNVTVWKSRVWFTQKDTAKCWYLAAGTIYGQAFPLLLAQTAFARGGGPLVGLYNWTMDGGVGVDDHLVAISQGGDVAVYKGSDPASASTFALVGSWFAGSLPKGRNIASKLGGDVALLTKAGLRRVSEIVSGGGDGSSAYITQGVANLFNSLMLTRSELPGWAIYAHPEDATLIITVPTTAGANTEQLVMSLGNKSWSRYRDLPLYSGCVWEGKFYFGSVDGKVYTNDGYVDGVTLADPNAFTAIQWAAQTAYNNLGNGRQKQVQTIRTNILSESTSPQFSVGARYKFSFSELDSVSGSTDSDNTWDGGLWDTATWAGEYTAAQEVRGAVGMGAEVSIVVRGTATSRTILVGFDVSFTQGGLL